MEGVDTPLVAHLFKQGVLTVTEFRAVSIHLLVHRDGFISLCFDIALRRIRNFFHVDIDINLFPDVVTFSLSTILRWTPFHLSSFAYTFVHHSPYHHTQEPHCMDETSGLQNDTCPKGILHSG